LRLAVLKTQNPTLADLGNWPASNIDGGHDIIRHAYEEVLTACARLISFSSGDPSIGHALINERQETLAIGDLISFAIHARRLIENTGQKSRFNKIEILFPTRPMLRMSVSSRLSKLERMRIWKAITYIIHNTRVYIIRDARSREAFYRGWEEVIFSNVSQEYFTPMVVVMSQEGQIVFPLRELVETFADKVLSPIIDLCAEHRLYLDDLGL
jgi:hypothetical protein